MAINEIQARSILQKSGIPGAAYVINPYTGCTHGCVYCYARFMKRFTGHSEPWGTFLDAKINAPELLRTQLERRRSPLGGEVFLSSVTDPYLSAEKKYRLTRGVLEVLLEHHVEISILTKSDLVLRDLDLLRQFDTCSVGLSMMTVDDDLAKRFEPRASSPSRRLQAFRKIKEHGIYTYAFISPFLPRLSDIEQIVTALDGAVDEIGVEALNIKGGNWTGVEQALAAYYPERLSECRHLAGDDVYWDVLEQQTQQLVMQYHLDFMGFFRH